MTFSAPRELDAHGAPAFEGLVRKLLVGGARTIRVLLGDVTFVDSDGVRALLNAHRSAAALDVSLVLADLSTPVEHALEMSGMRPHFEVEPSPASSS